MRMSLTFFILDDIFFTVDKITCALYAYSKLKFRMEIHSAFHAVQVLFNRVHCCRILLCNNLGADYMGRQTLMRPFNQHLGRRFDACFAIQQQANNLQMAF